MLELLRQLGVDWKLLLSQAFNFIILLAALTFFLYRPLLKLMRQRRQKIELGMRGAEVAELRIAQAEQVKQQKISEAEKSAVSIIKEAEKEALLNKEKIILEARLKSDDLLKVASDTAEHRRVEALRGLMAEAKTLVKEAIVKTVSLSPKEVDEKLIEEAIKKIKEEKTL